LQIWIWSPAWTLTADIAGWLVIHLGVSYLFFRMPDRWFMLNRLRTEHMPAAGRRKSREESFYDHILRVRLWKDKLPDGGSLFAGGFRKSRLEERNADYYGKFLLETRRGEWTHWFAMLPAPLFFMWNEAAYGWVMVLYALAANLPFIVILRYNRLRLARIRFKRNKEEWAESCIQ